MTYPNARKQPLTLEEHIARIQGRAPSRQGDPMRAIRLRDVGVLIANLATLVDELADVVAEGGEAVNLGALAARLKFTEASLRLTVDDTAKAAGLVAA